MDGWNLPHFICTGPNSLLLDIQMCWYVGTQPLTLTSIDVQSNITLINPYKVWRNVKHHLINSSANMMQGLVSAVGAYGAIIH